MTRLLGAAILSALATTGCLTSGIIYEARQPSRHNRSITGVTGATVEGDRVVIGLSVRRPDMHREEQLEIEVPLRDLGWARKNAVEGRPRVPGLIFARPPKRAVRRSTTGELKGTPIKVEPFDLKGREHLVTVGDGLAPGIHVLSLQNFPDPGQNPHTIPAVVDTRDAQAPYGIVIADLPDALTHKKLLLFLTPLTIPVDAVTFPLQLIVVILGGGC